MKNANHGAIDNAQLKSIVERIEKLNEDMASIAADVKEIYSEAKSEAMTRNTSKNVLNFAKKTKTKSKKKTNFCKCIEPH